MLQKPQYIARKELIKVKPEVNDIGTTAVDWGPLINVRARLLLCWSNR